MSSGLWYRTLVYLGLKEEPEEGYDELPERGVTAETPRQRDGRLPGDAAVVERTGPRERDAGWSGDVALRHERFDPIGDPDLDPSRRRSSDRDGASNVRPLRAADADHVAAGGGVRLAVVEIGRFEDVEHVGSRYRTGQPVLFDVSGADGAAARRVVDFVSGLTYALRGRMSKVGTRAFLLVPDGVALPDDEVQRLTTLGYRLPTGSVS